MSLNSPKKTELSVVTVAVRVGFRHDNVKKESFDRSVDQSIEMVQLRVGFDTIIGPNIRKLQLRVGLQIQGVYSYFRHRYIRIDTIVLRMFEIDPTLSNVRRSCRLSMHRQFFIVFFLLDNTINRTLNEWQRYFVYESLIKKV